MLLPTVIVHGGAGDWKDERIPLGMKYVAEAARVGFRVLKKSSSVLDAAEACTLFMESCGELNAGKGARPNQDDIIELDAMIIDGSRLDFGSVAAITGIQNPISLARYIMEKTEYKFFAGPNAKRVYDEMIAQGYRREEEGGAIRPPGTVQGADTVGCIVVDPKGRIAVTSSTGGISKKRPGRIGDSPVMGSGAYANSQCGATATGYGEHIMRVVLCRMVTLYVEEGTDPMNAARKGIEMLQKKTGSEAGIIVADAEGNIGYATNAKAMPVAFIQGKLRSMITIDCFRE